MGGFTLKPPYLSPQKSKPNGQQTKVTEQKLKLNEQYSKMVEQTFSQNLLS